MEVPSKSICAVAPAVEVTVRVLLKEADESSGTHSESEYVMDISRSSSLREVIKGAARRAQTQRGGYGEGDVGSLQFVTLPERVP